MDGDGDHRRPKALGSDPGCSRARNGVARNRGIYPAILSSRPKPARCGPVRRARYFAPALRGNITQQLGKWGKDGALTEKLADKVPKFDRDEKEVE
ncbi:MAG: hypothetical protein ACK55Z_35305, partial [bacterium]